MTAANLIGVKVSITISDPWDFGTENGTDPFSGKVLQIGYNYWARRKDALLLQLDLPLTYQGEIFEYFIASARHEAADFKSIINGSAVDCSFTRIGDDRGTSADPFNLSWWRGGIGLLGTLQKIL